jgi:hypothetical protein
VKQQIFAEERRSKFTTINHTSGKTRSLLAAVPLRHTAGRPDSAPLDKKGLKAGVKDKEEDYDSLPGGQRIGEVWSISDTSGPVGESRDAMVRLLREASSATTAQWPSIEGRVRQLFLVIDKAAQGTFFARVKHLVCRYNDVAQGKPSVFAPRWQNKRMPRRKSGQHKEETGPHAGEPKILVQTDAQIRLRQAYMSRLGSVSFSTPMRLPPLAVPSAKAAEVVQSMVDGTGVRVVTAFHAFGGGMAVAHSILQGGMAALSSLDAGFYGQGLYFTTDLPYALSHYGTKEDGTKLVLVAALVLGQPYPVIEPPHDTSGSGYYLPGLLGQPVVPPHDCHVSFVDGRHDAPMPAWHEPEGMAGSWSGAEAEGKLYSEIVVQDASQVLPLAILRVAC